MSNIDWSAASVKELTCNDCVASVYGKTEAQAIEKWNTREERTCHLVAVDKGYSIAPTCSECGYEWVQFSYCPNCGAKVVE